MPALIEGKWIAPFWGASNSLIHGQDMLGMQNTSIATYATLLPGLTNLTQRIRYYGFYMWLLEQYARTRGVDSISEFRRYMRRGELLLAFTMSHNYPDEKGVVGSRYAQEWLKKGEDLINIAAGADMENSNIYWQYSSGAFGQYYQGALSAIGLIAPSEKNSHILVCTEYGRSLAEMFESNINANIKDGYLEAIDQGSATINELKDFGESFSLTAIVPYSEEWKFYIEMLFGKDLPTVNSENIHTKFRVETILLYLEYLNNRKHFTKAGTFPRSFHYRLWDTKEPYNKYIACTGWHYYALNEFAHYSLETLLWTCLVELHKQGKDYLENFIRRCTDNITSKFKEICKNSDLQSLAFSAYAKKIYSDGFNPSLYSDYIEKKEEDDNAYDGAVRALHILALIYEHDRNSISELNRYAHKYGMYRDGDVTELLIWINKYEDLEITEFIHRLLLQHVINRHIEVAMRKLRNRNENTLKFVIEDNVMVPYGIIRPVWTGPRLRSLHQFLVDLSLIEKENDVLTELGKRILKEKLL